MAPVIDLGPVAGVKNILPWTKSWAKSLARDVRLTLFGAEIRGVAAGSLPGRCDRVVGLAERGCRRDGRHQRHAGQACRQRHQTTRRAPATVPDRLCCPVIHPPRRPSSLKLWAQFQPPGGPPQLGCGRRSAAGHTKTLRNATSRRLKLCPQGWLVSHSALRFCVTGCSDIGVHARGNVAQRIGADMAACGPIWFVLFTVIG